MAGSRIKDIIVEIGGDTTKLQAALKGVNSERIVELLLQAILNCHNHLQQIFPYKKMVC